jgi:hypothetical protein
MTIELFVRYGSLWTLILGVLGLGFAIRSYRRQVNAQIFSRLLDAITTCFSPFHYTSGPTCSIGRIKCHSRVQN